MIRTATAFVAAAALTAACGAEAPEATAPEAGPTVTIEVAPLSLPSVTEAAYTLTVENAADEVVWTRADLTSTGYGDGAGSLSFVGPCDADSNPNTITLTLDRLEDATGVLPVDTYVNPTPVSRDIVCDANSDVRVSFDMTILRDARQGFFDVAVEFSDVFCSAKLDCERAPGEPLELLHNPDTHAREQTAVVAFACTSGPGQNTTLYMDYLAISCDGGATEYLVDPSGGPGNMGGQAPMLFQTATYRGVEQLSGVQKLYWNTAIGLDVTALGAGCALTGKATASDQPFVGLTSPTDAVWPLIRWDVNLTSPEGAVACAAHPLNGAGSGVYTTYTGVAGGEPFAHGLGVNSGTGLPEVESAARVSCADAHFTEVGQALIFQAGGASTGPIPLPDGYALDATCCADPCCE